MALRSGNEQVDRQLKEVQRRLEALESAVPLQVLSEHVGTANTTVAHGLGRRPTSITPLATSPAAAITVVSIGDTAIVLKANTATSATLLLV